MTERLRAALAELPAGDEVAADAVAARASRVLRPAGALQRLDDVAVHIARWHGTSTPAIRRPAVLVFAANHGVAAADVSKYRPEVTAAMFDAVRADRATINALARRAGATLDVFDVGIDPPTGDIRFEPALSEERVDEIAAIAFRAVDTAVDAGADLLVLGELGIGNTTAAAALPTALLGGGPDAWVGRGTGIDDDGLARKSDAVTTAVARVALVSDPLDVMREIGGSELTAIAAACLRARRHRVPVVLDGIIGTAAVLPLASAKAGALDHCLAGHRSSERGHGRMLDHLGLRPLLDLDMRLGEGSGALAAVPLIDMACASVVEVATFEEWFDE